MLNEINLSRVDLNLLVIFEAVLEEAHVGRAADRLHLTPSAVSHGLGRLRRLLNDPLFLRTPKGVVATERALELSQPVAEVLARVRKIVAVGRPFDPATSERRFTIGASDGISAVFLPTLVEALSGAAPGVSLAVRQLLPRGGESAPERAWQPAFADLESRSTDIAIIPSDCAPARFESRELYREDFVIVMRGRPPRSGKLSLDRYCAMDHLVVSLTGDSHGFVDEMLARHGRRRRVALTVPNFMMALPMVASSDLVAAVPRRLAAIHAPRFGLAIVEPPLPIGESPVHALAPRTAMLDGGVAWLFGMLERCSRPDEGGSG